MVHRIHTVSVLIFLVTLCSCCAVAVGESEKDARGQCAVMDKSFVATTKTAEHKLRGWRLAVATFMHDATQFLDRINNAVENYLSASRKLLQEDIDKAVERQRIAPPNPYRIYGHPTIVKRLNANRETADAPQRKQRSL